MIALDKSSPRSARIRASVIKFRLGNACTHLALDNRHDAGGGATQELGSRLRPPYLPLA